MAQAMLYDGIEPIDDGGGDLLIPQQEAAITGIGIEHETHPHIVAFALHTIDASPLTPEAHPFRLAHADLANSWSSYSEKWYCLRRHENACARSTFLVRGMARAACQA